MSSSQYIIQGLDRKCTGDHDNVPLVGGRAAGAAIYPQALCEAICRGIAKHKKMDHSDNIVVSTGKMNTKRIKSFTNHLCSVQLRGSSAIRKIMFVRHKDGITRPTGDYPEHWTDEWHEEDGGDDVRGDRPQMGVTLLKAEMDGLFLKVDTRPPETM